MSDHLIFALSGAFINTASYKIMSFSSYPGRKFAKTCALRGREVAYYSHVFSVYDVTITYNFPDVKRPYFGELSNQCMKKNSIRTPPGK